MLLAKVVGTVVATRKDPRIEGLKFLLLRQVNPENLKEGGFVVANDAVGCGVGEYRPLRVRLLRPPDRGHEGPSLRRGHHGDRGHVGDRRPDALREALVRARVRRTERLIAPTRSGASPS